MFAAADALDGFNEVIPSVCFLDKPIRAAPQGFSHAIVSGKSGAQEDASPGGEFPQLGDGLDAAHVRQIDVENQEVGREFFAGRDRRRGVAFFSDDFVAPCLPREHRADEFPHETVVIDHDD
jgi:hypothetical protein